MNSLLPVLLPHVLILNENYMCSNLSFDTRQRTAPVGTTVSMSRRKVRNATISHTQVPKRPKRGYHRFRGGVLNVAPKGDDEVVL